MHTNFVTTLALAALMTMGGATIAAAQTCRAPAPNESGYGSRQLSLKECQQASAADPAFTSAFAPNVGPSAHNHPHGHRQR